MKLRPALLLLLIVCLYGLVGAMDAEDAERQHEYACEMVRLWIDTDGRQGWPPGDGHEELCDE